MAFTLPKPPHSSVAQDTIAWVRWFMEVARKLTASAAIWWTQVDKTGSNLTDIETRNHADLQNINTASYYHLTQTNHTDLTDGGATTLHKHDHGGQDGLSDDDHAQYVLVSNMEADRATIATRWDDLTDSGDSTLHYHASDRARANHTGTQAATTVLLDVLGSSTYDTLQDMQNVMHSAGWISGGAVTDNGDGTVAVALGTGAIRATDSDVATIYFFDWATDTSIALTDTTLNYVYVDYNAGTPIPVAGTVALTEHNTKVLLAEVYRDGTDLHINQTVRYSVGDHASKMVQEMQEIMPYAHVSGGILGETGTRNISVSAGVFWHGLTRFITAALDTSVAGSFSTYYRNGLGGFTHVTGQTQVDNTQYDDGDGTLGALSANRYTNRWVYLATDSDVHVLYGQAQHVLLSDALDEEPIATLPAEIQADSFLIGRIVVRQGTAAFIQVDSAYSPSFVSSAVSNHPDLSNLGWTSSGHTGTASRLAGFDGAGAASEYSLGTNVATFLATPSSANLAAAVTDKTGSGALVFGSSPTIDSLTISGTSGNLYAGSWTPTLTDTTNIASSTASSDSLYIRMGTIVHFSLPVTIDPTATGEFELGISLPIASNFTGATNASGVGTANVGAVGAITDMQVGAVRADVTNDRLIFFGYSPDTTARSWKITGAYRII